ncbi:MAG: hypothetical protein ACI9R3_000602 [Verrucomicrobiales bacterium]|jgi:hypothetical protein
MLNFFHHLLVKVLPVIMTGALMQVCAVAQENRAATATIELAEKSAALDAAVARIQRLQGQLVDAEKQAQALREGLATANVESQEFSKAYQDLRVKVEALGPELLEKGDSGIRTKLLNAVSDLGIVQRENDRLADQLLTMTEAVMAFLSLEDEAQQAELLARLELELRASDGILGFRMDSSGDRRGRALESAQIVSLKKEWGLAVFDAGSMSGVKIGTPIEIIRAGQVVATATVVDVRESISGAILTSPNSQELVRTKDGIRLAAETNLQN